MVKYLIVAASAVMSLTAANATIGTPPANTTIVNLAANSVLPNAGQNSGGYIYNPVVVSLTAGNYSVGVVGTGTVGALYNGYSVYAPTLTNGAYTDGNWSFSGTGVATQTQASTQRFNTVADSLAYYGALSPLTFSLAQTTNVSFYVDDTAIPYFFDDAGGVSLAVTRLAGAVPEPASWALMIVGFGAVGAALRSSRRAAVRFA